MPQPKLRVISSGVTVDEKQAEVSPLASRLSQLLQLSQPEQINPADYITPQVSIDEHQDDLATQPSPLPTSLIKQFSLPPQTSQYQQAQQPSILDNPASQQPVPPGPTSSIDEILQRMQLQSQSGIVPEQFRPSPTVPQDQLTTNQPIQQDQLTQPIKEFNPLSLPKLNQPNTDQYQSTIDQPPEQEAPSNIDSITGVDVSRQTDAAEFMGSLPQVAQAMPKTQQQIKQGKQVTQSSPLPVRRAMPSLDEVSPILQPPRRTGNKAVVSIADKKVIIYNSKGEVVKEFPAYVGKASTPTPRGQFRIMENIVPPKSEWYYGGHWLGFATNYTKDPSGKVPYAGFHGWQYDKEDDEMEKQEPGWKTSTGGCVQLSNPDVAILASLLGAGDEVSIVAEPIAPPAPKPPKPRGLMQGSRMNSGGLN